MSKVLVIKTHPLTKNESTTLQMLDTFLETYKETHPNDEIEVVDTFSANIPAIDTKMFNIWATDKEKLTDQQKNHIAKWNEYADQFLASDKVVVANPLYNLSFPAPFKHWIDAIMQAGKTFKYTENGPVGLAAGRKVIHLQSSGSVWNGEDLATKYIDDAFKFMGIDEVEHIYIEGKDIPALHAEAITKGITRAKEAAKNF